jgi:hypothetical protein
MTILTRPYLGLALGVWVPYSAQFLSDIGVLWHAFLGTCGNFTKDTHGQQWPLTVIRKCLRLWDFCRKTLERVTGIEPAWPAWKAGNESQ